MRVSLEFDPYSYEIHEDPYPVYRRLRDEAPAYFNEKRGFWALSRYDDVRAALNDWRTYTSTEGITIEPRRRGTEPHIIEMDPPRHTQLRAIVSRAFTPNRMVRLEEPIRARTRALLAPVAEAGGIDLITDFAALLPMAVISEMLGVPDSDQDRLRHAADALLHREPDSDDITPDGIEGAATLYAYFDALIRERRNQPADDLLSVLMTAEEEGDVLSASELLGFCFLLIIAGNETTTKLVGNAIYWLAENPDQRSAIADDPALIPGAVEETLRYDGSTQAMARCLTRDVELHGETMRAGTKVLLLLGSADRDEGRWPAADQFDIRRDTAGHVAFGHGIHHCLGAALARLEARVALEELLPVLGDYVVEKERIRRVHSGNVRGFASLPLRVPERAP
jgi:cytochrome P450